MVETVNKSATDNFDYETYSLVLDAQFKKDPALVISGLRQRVLKSPPHSKMEDFSWKKWCEFNERQDLTDQLISTYSWAKGVSLTQGQATSLQAILMPRENVASRLFEPSPADRRNAQTFYAMSALGAMSVALPPMKDHLSREAANGWAKLYIELHKYDSAPNLELIDSLGKCSDPAYANLRQASHCILRYFESDPVDDLRKSVGDCIVPKRTGDPVVN